VALGDDGLSVLIDAILKMKSSKNEKEFSGVHSSTQNSDEHPLNEHRSSLISLGLRNNGITSAGALSVSKILVSPFCSLTDIQLKGIHFLFM
jgi:hypothetical protein